MHNVGLIYFSATGVTQALAKALRKGLETTKQVKVLAHEISGKQIIHGRFVNTDLMAKLADCDALIFGSPTYMGGVAAQFKAFVDATSESWSEQKWAGKLAAGFTCGSNPNGDQSSTLQYMSTFASQHGMLWAGLDTAPGFGEHGVNRLGCQLGVVAYAPEGNAHPQDLASAEYLGRRVARLLLNTGQRISLP